jgi:hypothetical protein
MKKMRGEMGCATRATNPKWRAVKVYITLFSIYYCLELIKIENICQMIEIS